MFVASETACCQVKTEKLSDRCGVNAMERKVNSYKTKWLVGVMNLNMWTLVRAKGDTMKTNGFLKKGKMNIVYINNNEKTKMGQYFLKEKLTHN